ncbi:hypothetical protein [Streptomyces sp. NBC_00239]|uniref:hypothetical protein n=1 Tax=Streptomyces sp. NBC_00239 TaxID=2903640 RepID=UPI002E2944CA|nr:hypothetical protein [Streptomyces sp. NBC_00239]
MSCSSLADSSVLRLVEPVVPPVGDRALNVPQSDAAKAKAAAGVTGNQQLALVDNANVLSQLTSFIPTETLAVYVAAMTALADPTPASGKPLCTADWNGHWWWSLALLVATAALISGLSYRKQQELRSSQQGVRGNKKEGNEKEGVFNFPYVEVIAGLAGFAIWASSLPSTPLRTFCGYEANVWSPVILLAGTVAIASTLHITGKSVNWVKVLKA